MNKKHTGRRASRREFLGSLAAGTAFIAWQRLLGDGGVGIQDGEPEATYFRAIYMVGRVTGTQAILNLVTAAELAAVVSARVRWAEDPADLPDSELVSDVKSTDQPTDNILLKMSGLSADTTYHYLVQYETSDAPGEWMNVSRTGQFHTQRPPGASFSFCTMADAHWGKEGFEFDPGTAYGYNGQQCVQRIIEAGPFDFCVDLGDAPFLVPIHSQDDAYYFYERYRAMLQPLLERMPLYLVLGNHEHEAGYFQHGDDGTISSTPVGNGLGPLQYHQKWATAARKTFIPNPRADTYPEGGEGPPNYDSSEDWGAGDDPWNNGPSSHLGNFYAWSWGDALFIVLDPYRYTRVGQFSLPTYTTEWTLGPTQMQWLQDTLANSTARWKFILCHHLVGGGQIGGKGKYTEPGVGIAYGRGSATEAANEGAEQAVIHELMKQHCVQFFVYGHDHAFCHSVRDGVNYIQCARPTWLNPWYVENGMQGSYGDLLVQGTNNPFVKKLYTVLGYARFAVSPSKVTMQWVRTGYSLAPNGPIDFENDLPARDWLESWFGKTYPVTAADAVTVAGAPTDVDGVRTVAGAAISELYQVPPGPDYYQQPVPTRPESFEAPVIPLQDFPAETETEAVVDYVPEIIYEVEWHAGDVNSDGVVDGDDIQPFVRVKQTGEGTQMEQCAAAQSETDEFINKLLERQ